MAYSTCNMESECVGFSDADWAGDVNDQHLVTYFNCVVELLAGGARSNLVLHCQLLKQNIWLCHLLYKKLCGSNIYL